MGKSPLIYLLAFREETQMQSVEAGVKGEQ